MKIQSFKRILYRFFAFFVSCCFSFYAVFSISSCVVSADDTPSIDEFVSLPASVDVSVENFSDYFNLSYNGNTYFIDKTVSYLVNIDGSKKLPYSINSDGSISYCSSKDYCDPSHYSYTVYYPVNFFDTYPSYSGKNYGLSASSFWFSPLENSIYIFSGSYNTTTEKAVTVKSYLNGYLYFDNHYSSGTPIFIYCLNLDTMSLSFCSSQCTDNIRSVWMLDDTNSRVLHYLPTDLLCVYSTYEISGFYNFDSSRVHTPDYYFDYQYIFYSEDTGYTFIDSASRLTDIGFPSNVNTARYFFEDICNSYIYTSSDGVTWKLKTTKDTIYSSFFDLNYGVPFAGNYILVYTSDSSYGEEAIIPPEYGEITDITSDLNSFLDDYNIVHSSGRGSINNLDYICVEDPSSQSLLALFMASFSYDYVYYCTYSVYLPSGTTIQGSYPEIIHIYFFTSDIPSQVTASTGDRLSLIRLLYEGEPLEDSEVLYNFSSSTKIPSVVMYSRLMNNSLSNIDSKLGAFKSDTYNGLNSIFLNISNTNLYLDKLYTSLSSLPLSLSNGLSSLNDSVVSLGDSINSILHSSDSQLLSLDDIYNVNSDILSALQNLSLPGTGTDSGEGGEESVSLDIDLSGIIHRLDALIALNTIDLVLNDDEDEDSDHNTIIKYAINAIEAISSGAIFSAALSFDDNVLSGFSFVNDKLTRLYDSSGKLAPVIILPLTLTVVDVLFRRSSS